jgi:hypothetical protein
MRNIYTHVCDCIGRTHKAARSTQTDALIPFVMMHLRVLCVHNFLQTTPRTLPHADARSCMRVVTMQSSVFSKNTNAVNRKICCPSKPTEKCVALLDLRLGLAILQIWHTYGSGNLEVIVTVTASDVTGM